jgi:hypothetical protein
MLTPAQRTSCRVETVREVVGLLSSSRHAARRDVALAHDAGRLLQLVGTENHPRRNTAVDASCADDPTHTYCTVSPAHGYFLSERTEPRISRAPAKCVATTQLAGTENRPRRSAAGTANFGVRVRSRARAATFVPSARIGVDDSSMTVRTDASQLVGTDDHPRRSAAVDANRAPATDSPPTLMRSGGDYQPVGACFRSVRD